MIPPIRRHGVESVEEASRLLRELGDDAVVYAGGTELVPLMKLGLATPSHLIDVKSILDLHILAEEDGDLVVGGAVTHRDIERSPLVRTGWPSLAEMERSVGNLRVRNVGTLGGNLCFADPHSDPATFLTAAGATVILGSDEGYRQLRIEDFLMGAFQTARTQSELLVATRIPGFGPGTAMHHVRLEGDLRPILTVASRVTVRTGKIRTVKLAVGSVGGSPALIQSMDDLLRNVAVSRITNGDGLPLMGELAAAVAGAIEIPAESRISPEYGRHAAGVLARRAVAHSVAKAAATP